MSPDSAWKALASHAQKAHFFLLTVCLVFLVGSNLGTSADVDVADQDLGRIRDLVDRWNSEWIVQSADSVAQDNARESKELRFPSITSGTELGVVSVHGMPSRRIILGNNWSLLPAPRGVTALQQQNARFSDEPWPEAPSTLLEFIHFWDALDSLRLHTVLEVGRAAIVVRDVKGQRIVTMPSIESGSSHDIDSAVVQLMPGFLKSGSSEPPRDIRALADSLFMAGYVDHDENQGATVERDYILASGESGFESEVFVVPVLAESGLLGGRAAFQNIAGTHFHLEDFRSGFPDLAYFGEPYANFPFDVLTRILQIEKRRNTAAFTFLGAQIPAAQLLLVGVPLLVIAQLYLALLVRRLRKLTHAPPSFRGAWLAVAEDRASALLTALSLTLLPCATAASLFKQASGGLHTARDYIGIVTLSVIVLSIGSGTTRVLMELRARKSASLDTALHRSSYWPE